MDISIWECRAGHIHIRVHDIGMEMAFSNIQDLRQFKQILDDYIKFYETTRIPIPDVFLQAFDEGGNKREG